MPAFWDPAVRLPLKLTYHDESVGAINHIVTASNTASTLAWIFGKDNDTSLVFDALNGTVQLGGASWASTVFVPPSGQRSDMHVTFTQSGLIIRRDVQSVLFALCGSGGARGMRMLRVQWPGYTRPDAAAGNGQKMQSLDIPFSRTSTDDDDGRTRDVVTVLVQDITQRIERAPLTSKRARESMYPIFNEHGGACAAGAWFYRVYLILLDRLRRDIDRAMTVFCKRGENAQPTPLEIALTRSLPATGTRVNGADLWVPPDSENDAVVVYLANGSTDAMQKFVRHVDMAGTIASHVGEEVLASHAALANGVSSALVVAERRKVRLAGAVKKSGAPLSRTSQSMTAFYARALFARACDQPQSHARECHELHMACLIDVTASLYAQFVLERKDQTTLAPDAEIDKRAAELQDDYLGMFADHDDNEKGKKVKRDLAGRMQETLSVIRQREMFFRLRSIATTPKGKVDTAVNDVKRYLALLLIQSVPAADSVVTLLPTRMINCARLVLVNACTKAGIDTGVTESWDIVDHLCQCFASCLAERQDVMSMPTDLSRNELDNLADAPFVSTDRINRYLSMVSNMIMDVAGWPRPRGTRFGWPFLSTLLGFTEDTAAEVKCTMVPSSLTSNDILDAWVVGESLRRRCA